MDELKELKEKLRKTNQLLDKLDERLVEGELTEAKYRELAGKYRAEADSLKNQIAEKELLQEVGLGEEEKEKTRVEYPTEPQKKGYLSKVIQRLRNEGFDIYENVTYNGYFFKYVARKVGGIVFAEVFCVFAEFPTIDIYSLREFSTNCCEYAKETRSSSQLMRNLICFPVAMVNSMDRATSEYIRHEAPPKHLGFFEMPVIYDLNSSTLYYFEKTPFWGMAIWGPMRESIQRLLVP